MDWFKRKTDKVGEHEVQRKDKRIREDGPVEAPNPSLLGTGKARQAGEALKKHNKSEKEQLDEITKDL